MANVTQKIPSLIGGVSRLADFDKKDDEVREAVNCYPDLSYGLTKRPGTQFIGALGITEEEAEQTYFFPLIREGRDRYLVGLRSAGSLADSIKIWNLDNGLSTVTVNAKEGQDLGYGYLSFVSGISGVSQNDAYRVASDDKRTVIVNRTQVCQEDKVEWQNLPVGFEWGRGLKRNVNSVDDLPGGEVLKVNWGYGGESQEQSKPLRPGTHYLPTTVAPAKPDGRIQTTKATGCVLKCNIDEFGAIIFKGAYREINGEEVFVEYTGRDSGWVDQPGDRQIYDASVWAAGTAYPDQTTLNIDGVEGARCSTATGLNPGFVHRVINSGSNQDDAYFQPFSNTSTEDDIPGVEPPKNSSIDGPYYWKECPAPDSYAGLNQETLPHELIDNQDGTFTFGQLDYSNRWAGNNANNPAPSFIDNRINGVFFLNNRLAFLSEDNIILSRPINYGPEGTTSSEYVPDDNPWVRRNYSEVDFFRQSAMGLTAADPIDLKVASNNTSILQKAIPTPQGTILFSDGQQSLLFQPQGLLSPLTASINSISNYDMTDDVEPIIVGETCYFINKGANFCRIYSLVNRGMQNPPIIEDVTKEVSDWLPNNLTDMRASLTDDMLLAYARDYRTIYCRRVVTEKNSSWTKWVLPDSLVEIFVDHDEVFYLTKTDGSVQVHRADMYVVPDDSSYVYSPVDGRDEAWNGIPDGYNFENKIIGYKQLNPGKFGTIEYYAPWHDYYENGTQNQYDRWLSLENIGWTSAIVSALYSVEVDLANSDQWNVGYRIKVKLRSNEVIDLPNDGTFQRLPYDTIFRINSGSNLSTDYIDGCVETNECSLLKYMTPEGFVNDTGVWGNKIEDIDTSSDPVVVTLRHCDGEPANEVSIPKDDFHDAFLLNIAKNNCSINPEDFQYVRIVIDDATISVPDLEGFQDPEPSTILRYSGNFEYVESRSAFPIKDYWYKKSDNWDGPFYFGMQAATVRSNSSLGCAGTNWGRLDEFFCQQNPGTLLGGAQISYTSSVNYRYVYATNSSDTYPDTRPDINRSADCQLRDTQFIGEYTEDESGDPTGIVGKRWGTYNYVAPVTLDSRDWYSRDYSNYVSSCAYQDKFTGYTLGGWITRRGDIPNVSGFDTVGWAYDGYDSTSPWDFLGDPELYEDPGVSINNFYVSFQPPYYGKEDDQETSLYQDYLIRHGQEPPRKIFIRTHFEFTNSPDPYSSDAEINIYTDEVSESCDSCPPTPLPIFPNEYRDITLTPYLDFYTNLVTLETLPEDEDPSKLRVIVPPTDYPYIPNLQPCLLIARLPGQDEIVATDKAGYQVDLRWNESRDKLIAPLDLAPYAGKVVIGYRYDMMIELPRFYFKEEKADYTAALNIARIKTALGYSGDCVLELRSNNNRGHWSKYFSATQSNIYEADDTPITESSLHTLPVHRRTQDFYFRINSDSPFPLSVDSVTWEGNYSPRYYRRM